MKLLSALVLFAAISLVAPAGAADKTAKLPVSVFAIAYAEGLPSVFVKSGESDYQNVTLSTANVVEGREALAEAGRISLYGPADGNGEHPVVATAEIGGIQQPLLVILPAKEGELPAYQAKAVEAAIAKFPLGSFKFVNLSPNAVRASYGEVVIEIESGGENLFKPNVRAGEAMAVTIDSQNEGTWSLMSSARWAARSDRRTLVCFYLDPSTKRMLVKSVPLRDKAK